MRINVYAEELTYECEVVEKEVFDERFGARTFYGIRMYLASPEVLHHSPEDDDRSAITFWVPWTAANGNQFHTVRGLLAALGGKLGEAEMRDTENQIERLHARRRMLRGDAAVARVNAIENAESEAKVGTPHA